MHIFKLAALSVALLGVPAAAQSLSETHQARWTQPGKIPSVTFHQIRKSCNPVAPLHLSGKSPTAAQARTCDAPAASVSSKDEAETPRG